MEINQEIEERIATLKREAWMKYQEMLYDAKVWYMEEMREIKKQSIIWYDEEN